MTIDLEGFKDVIWQPISDYTGVPQLLKANQEVPKKRYKYPRILYYFLTKGEQVNNRLIETREVVESESEDFEHDILHKFYLNPQMILSFQGFGLKKGQVLPYMQKLAQWFQIRKLGKEFLRDYDCIVRNVNQIDDVTTTLDKQHEERLNLDIELQFEDVVEVRIDTIEEIEINGKKID
ncbi:LIC_12616 family protein [Natroniella sp. ANB-PHB2]|uniref:phage neck terminator protein n=1 Tax=Natroniella sp. ANB-PHB2 TaxID=3384444 RepID=UPI0038D404E1